MTGEGLAWGSTVIFIAGVLSKILGLVREMLIALFFGAQAVTDSYVVASVLPATIAGLIGGALTTVFIPVFVGERERSGEARAWEGARAVLGSSFFFLLLMLGLAYIVIPFFLRLIAPGFDDYRFRLALQLSQVMLPSLVFLGLLGLFIGLFQSYRLFTLPALAGLLFNVCFISFLLVTKGQPIISLGLGTVVAIVVQLLILVFAASRKWPLGLGLRFSHPTVLQVWKLLVPILVGTGVGYLNLIVDRIFASLLPTGTVAALNFAARVKELPIGLFGMAISQAIYPVLSLQAAKQERSHLKELVSRSLEILWLFMVPASVGLMVLSRGTIGFLFERGAFTPTATTITAEVLFFYSLGLVTSGSLDIVGKAFYAHRDTKTPVKVGIIGLATNIVLNWSLIRPLAHKGLALATSLSSILTCLILTEILRRRLGGIGGKALIRNLIKIMIASGIMAVVLLPLRGMADVWWGYLSAVAIGVVVYGACILILRPRCAQTILEIGRKKARLWLGTR